MADTLIPLLGEGDFEIDEKQRSATFTDAGIEKLEAALVENGQLKGENLYDIENVALVHHLNSALRAHKMFQREKDYIVRNDEVVIIDEFTGRMMPGRRYSEGLHQALEAKEHVRIQPENQTLASITFQNYFRLYEKLAGMTGTAATEAEEFGDIYNLDVVTVPTNMPVARQDDDDAIFRTAAEKFDAITEVIVECRKRAQPVLVGTTSIEKSEMLAELLRKRNVGELQVLNARYHEQEAHIIAQAGRPGAITIATNMAGRGTDIQLGGNLEMRVADEAQGLEGEALAKKTEEIKATIAADKQKVIEAGGLMIIGTERHESRRIDNQLRGRAGRQGDPGHSKFFLSLQDDLMRIFPVESMDSMLSKLGLSEGESITHPWVTKAIERAQAKVEARNFDIRKNILKFDDVMNDQRKVIFEQRLELMDDDNVSETITGMRHDAVEAIVAKAVPERAYPEQWDGELLTELARTQLNVEVPFDDWVAEDGIDAEQVRERLIEMADNAAATREAEILARFEAVGQPNPTVMRNIEKSILLQSIDGLWREHLVTLDHLSKVVGWRGVGQRDPLNEYKQEAYELFQKLLSDLREMVTSQLAHVDVQLRRPEPPPELALSEIHLDPASGENELPDSLAGLLGAGPRGAAFAEASGALLGAAGGGASPAVAGRGAAADPGLAPIDPRLLAGVSRNAPCPCGSGKKFKHCHGAY
jgi:preprotein translocase subunit SecA